MAAPSVRSQTAPTSGMSATSPVDTSVGDIVIVITFERAGAGVPTHTLQEGFTQLQTIAHDDGSTDGRLSAAYKVATQAGAQVYQAYTSSTGSPVAMTAISVVTGGTYSLTGVVVPTGVSNIGTNPPDPPNPSGLVGTTEYLCYGVGAWHLSSSVSVTPGAMPGYGNLIDVSGSANIELAVNSRQRPAGGSVENPGAFTDNVTPNGTCSLAWAIPAGTEGGTTSFPYSGTGGYTHAGIGTHLFGAAITTAGGLAAGGTAPVDAETIDTFTYTGEGGGSVAGSAGIAVGLTGPVSGGATLSGQASVTLSIVHAGAGGLTAGGTGAPQFETFQERGAPLLTLTNAG